MLNRTTDTPVTPTPTPEILEKLYASGEFKEYFVESFRFETYDQLLESYPKECRQLIIFLEKINIIPKYVAPTNAAYDDPVKAANKIKV